MAPAHEYHDRVAVARLTHIKGNRANRLHRRHGKAIYAARCQRVAPHFDVSGQDVVIGLHALELNLYSPQVRLDLLVLLLINRHDPYLQTASNKNGGSLRITDQLGVFYHLQLVAEYYYCRFS
ncbi:hypothetical protein EVAR_39884_1 [Eumeta japonica]|uniref:Uncharacterized protein n=1 Tax=Eumeta variegata TaxID=151549 RepID=A0A4C1WSB2_EUMVA|nr:hypothetical protein EVAR_39884_1 [Eumeta japonica]